MFNSGDTYIQFTKFGGVNKGKVKTYNETFVIDTKNCVRYLKPHIITEKNIVLDLDGSDGKIFKVEKEYTTEEIKELSIINQKITEDNRLKPQEYRNGVEL